MSLRICWLLTALALTGCRIVSQQELAELKNPPNPQLGNVAQTWQQKLVPQLVSEAKPLDEMMKNLQSAKDFDTACQQFGYRAQEENPCVFVVSFAGTIAQLNTASRSGKVAIKTADGEQVTLQLGPIIRGTALRDSYRGSSYQDFNDQVLYGDFGRAINDQASQTMKVLQPKVGQKVRVVGVFSSWDIPATVPEITPARVER